MKLWIWGLLLVVAHPLFPQLGLPGSEFEDRCEKYLKVPLPSEVDVTAPKEWPDCNSYKSYSGIGRPVDLEAARRCAWSERLAAKANLEPKFTVASIFGGSAMLSVLYANGEGVERDLPLAMHFACESGWAPAEFFGRIDHLESLEDNPASSGHFDFCDDITSGAMEGFCAAYQREIADQDRTRALEAIAAHMTGDQRSVFHALIKAQETYAQAHGDKETDQGGTARAMIAIDAEQGLRDDFLSAIQAFEGGKYPGWTKADLAIAEAKLNAAYRKALADAKSNKDYFGGPHPDGIRDAERDWLTYRDAWVAFANLRYPTVPPEAWVTLLTKVRTSILDGSFCDREAFEDGDKTCPRDGDEYKPLPLP